MPASEAAGATVHRGGTYICKWWNGYSASLDLTHPEAVKYFQGRLTYLGDEYGVDGFKLDAGDARAPQAARLADAVSGLPPDQRDAMLLKLEGGLDLETIARVTGVGRETAKSRLRYATARLKQALSGERTE